MNENNMDISWDDNASVSLWTENVVMKDLRAVRINDSFSLSLCVC